MKSWNEDIDKAPYMEVLEVTNKHMGNDTILATRGYILRGMVHSDQTYFTQLNGELACPTKWRKTHD